MNQIVNYNSYPKKGVWGFGALRTFNRQYSEFVWNNFIIFPSSMHDLRNSSQIFSALFHLPCPIFGVRRESFRHFSIYPTRLPEFAGNLSSNFPYTFADLQRSPEIFSAFFHYPHPISVICHDSFQKLFIFPFPMLKK